MKLASISLNQNLMNVEDIVSQLLDTLDSVAAKDSHLSAAHFSSLHELNESNVIYSSNEQNLETYLGITQIIF